MKSLRHVEDRGIQIVASILVHQEHYLVLMMYVKDQEFIWRISCPLVKDNFAKDRKLTFLQLNRQTING